MHTTQQVAKEIGLAQNTIKKYIQWGYIKAEKIGRDWLIDDYELDRLVKKYNKKIKHK